MLTHGISVSRLSVKKPRLLKSWKDIESGVQVGARLSSQELFFHVCFAVLFGTLRANLQNDHDLLNFTLAMFSIWSLLASFADYATRFNDEDVVHKIFWAGYGICLVSLIMHSRGEENRTKLFLSVAFGFLWIGAANLRVAAHLQSCRVFAGSFGLGHWLIAALWCCVALVPMPANLNLALRFLGAAAHQFITMSTVVFVPRKYDQPMNIEYHVAKFGGIMTLAMGQTIIALALDPLPVCKDCRPKYYLTIMLGFLLLFSLKLVVAGVESISLDSHAIRYSRPTALAWLLLCQPALLYFIVLTAGGIGSVTAAVQAGQSTLFGSRLLCFGYAGVLFTLLITTLQHRPPIHAHHKPVWSGRSIKERVLLVGTLLLLAVGCYPPILKEHYTAQTVFAVIAFVGILSAYLIG